jgi:hypothetical protein
MDDQTKRNIARYLLRAWAKCDLAGPDPAMESKIVERWPGATAEDVRQAGILAIQMRIQPPEDDTKH